MNVNALKSGTDKTGYAKGKCLAVLVCLLLMPWSFRATAQDEATVEVPLAQTIELLVTLPSSRQMALALVNPSLRNEALLDLAAAQSVIDYARQHSVTDHGTLAQKFIDDRGWLARLVERYGWAQPRSAVLDPAAWLVLEELRQHNLQAMALVYPDQTPTAVLIYQVFQRAGERLAAANLPILLLRLEAEAIMVWSEFLQLTGSNGQPDAAWGVVESQWFTQRRFPSPFEPWSDNQPAADDEAQQTGQFITESLQALSQLALSAVDARPPDIRQLSDLRFSLLSHKRSEMHVQAASDLDQGRDILYIASLVDGLQDGHYFEFVQGVLAITTGLLESAEAPAEPPLLASWLQAELPAISGHYAVTFAAEDPGLNAAMAGAYKVLQFISNPAADAAKVPWTTLADAVAQLALLIPDMGYYFNTPVRAPIVEEINLCTSIAASRNDDGYPAITRSQFDACIEKLLLLADQETRMAELSGNFNGPFTSDSLRRELRATPEQRINYGIGYLHNRYSTDCPAPATALPNPLEWAVLATTMTWFAEHFPEFFITPENESRLASMRNIGEQLILGLAEQASCFAGADIHDPVYRSMVDYETALRALNAGTVKAEADFRTERLRPGADIALELDAGQSTGYRPDNLAIEPCDLQRVCEMSASLTTTRALIGLFPEEYLLAEQSGMGKIQICYRNMEWVDRRSELVRPDDENVANYFGHLGFDLVGRYIENDRVSDLFGFRFTSPEEYHYLFAQVSGEVLQDSCPMEWVGTRVITPLREDRGGIVPDRLTYLAASRTLPSRLLQGNWENGAEWRDWFVTGIGVTPIEFVSLPDISSRLNQHLQSLYQAEQAQIYSRMLLPNARNSKGDDVSLFEEMSRLSVAKASLHMQMMLFYPESMFNSNSIRKAIAGDEGLLERRSLRRFREENIALTSVNQLAANRLRELQQAWSHQPAAVRSEGSNSASLTHAMTRINILYRQFFTSRPESLEEIQVQVLRLVKNS